jgi:hypothetical protein
MKMIEFSALTGSITVVVPDVAVEVYVKVKSSISPSACVYGDAAVALSPNPRGNA